MNTRLHAVALLDQRRRIEAAAADTEQRALLLAWLDIEASGDYWPRRFVRLLLQRCHANGTVSVVLEGAAFLNILEEMVAEFADDVRDAQRFIDHFPGLLHFPGAIHDERPKEKRPAVTGRFHERDRRN